MNSSTLKFKFIALNLGVIVILFLVMILFMTRTFKEFIMEERIESRAVVNEQAAFSAVTLVIYRRGKTGSQGIFNEFLSKHQDIVYCAAVGFNYDGVEENDVFISVIKNEKMAKEYEDLVNKRPDKTEVFERDGMLHIISPVHGIDNEGKEGILGYVLSGYSLEDLLSKLNGANWIVILTIAVIAIVVSIIAYIMTSLFLKPLNNAVEVINCVANGDFTSGVSVKSKSEIGVLLNTINKMVETWRQSIKHTKEVVGQTNESTKKMSDNAKLQERGTSEQATSINEITTTVDELHSSSKQVYEKAEQVSKSSNGVLKIASEGQGAVEKSIEEINSIQGKVRAISEHTLNLSVEAQQIGTIVKTVSDISNKTDMLAINAGIEAARAGEHGKGFSIVATEVRELADQSQKSADKIAGLIENIQSATNSTVMSTEEAIKGFQVGIKLILEAGQTIDNLIKHIQETVNQASEIAFASRQQSVGTEQVANVMSTINEGMRTTAMSAASILDEANNLKKLSKDLSDVANTYKI